MWKSRCAMTYIELVNKVEELDYLTSEFDNEELLKEYEWYKKLLEGTVC